MNSDVNRGLPGLSVSRETLARLDRYAEGLRRWSASLNLVSRSTLDQIWTRHFLDSAQLFNLADDTANTWADMGSGAGFPGLVIAAVANEFRPDISISLIESDHRKSIFLEQMTHEMELVNVRVLNKRIEDVALEPVGVLSARALAPLERLLDLSHRFMSSDSIALFPKGRGYAEEVAQARQRWRFDLELLPSLSDTEARILRIRNLGHA